MPWPGIVKATIKIMIKAKFVVESVTQLVGQQIIEAKPVVNGSEENKSFSKWTPGGILKLWITNETPAYEQLKPGQEFLMEINPII